MKVLVKIKFKHLTFLLLLAILAFSILFLPSREERTYYWQEKLFSPGQISLAHLRNLSGNPIYCQDCHRPGQAISNSVCRECHDDKNFHEQAPLLADSHRLFNQKDRCLRCHGEHKGLYPLLKVAGFSPQEHRLLPMKTDDCLACHQEAGRQAHPTLTEDKCSDCHKNYSWESDYQHLKYLAEAKSPEEMLDLCQRCHSAGYHYSDSPKAKEGCIFCHEFWSKERKKRAIPFPEELFREIRIDLKNFSFR